MSRNRFRQVKWHVRFNKRSSRATNLLKDKFCMISWVLNRFVANSIKSYVPEIPMTVDGQLFPTKTRYHFCDEFTAVFLLLNMLLLLGMFFTQYMSSKPDKFGIKFWILADVETKYCYNVLPYLGKDKTRTTGLGTHVVMKLAEPCSMTKVITLL